MCDLRKIASISVLGQIIQVDVPLRLVEENHYLSPGLYRKQLSGIPVGIPCSTTTQYFDGKVWREEGDGWEVHELIVPAENVRRKYNDQEIIDGLREALFKILGA
jgi:hypothetical protein